jgi:biopolymer transport protein ExbD
MAEIIQQEGGGKKKGKRRAKKHSTHIDMTPMVDLACLLLTFFMLTTAFNKPKIMEIVLPEPPKKGDPAPPKIPGNRALTIILDENNRVFWYAGNANPLKPPLPEVHETDFSKDGIRKVLLNRNRKLFTLINDYNTAVTEGKIVAPRDTVQKVIREYKKEDKAGPIVLVKATDKANYGDMVNMVDELTITDVPRYSIVDINGLDKKMIGDYKKSHTD